MLLDETVSFYLYTVLFILYTVWLRKIEQFYLYKRAQFRSPILYYLAFYIVFTITGIRFIVSCASVIWKIRILCNNRLKDLLKTNTRLFYLFFVTSMLYRVVHLKVVFHSYLMCIQKSTDLFFENVEIWKNFFLEKRKQLSAQNLKSRKTILSWPSLYFR